ncbi:MAG: hypothetical protein ACTSXQ_01420 [Alphaproteobacteria bacterium]
MRLLKEKKNQVIIPGRDIMDSGGEAVPGMRARQILARVSPEKELIDLSIRNNSHRNKAAKEPLTREGVLKTVIENLKYIDLFIARENISKNANEESIRNARHLRRVRLDSENQDNRVAALRDKINIRYQKLNQGISEISLSSGRDEIRRRTNEIYPQNRKKEIPKKMKNLSVFMTDNLKMPEREVSNFLNNVNYSEVDFLNVQVEFIKNREEGIAVEEAISQRIKGEMTEDLQPVKKPSFSFASKEPIEKLYSDAVDVSLNGSAFSKDEKIQLFHRIKKHMERKVLENNIDTDVQQKLLNTYRGWLKNPKGLTVSNTPSYDAPRGAEKETWKPISLINERFDIAKRRA